MELGGYIVDPMSERHLRKKKISIAKWPAPHLARCNKGARCNNVSLINDHLLTAEMKNIHFLPSPLFISNTFDISVMLC